MDDKPHNSPKREIVVDSDRISTAAMALLILLTLLLAIGDVRAVLRGHIKPVSYNTVILAVCMMFLAMERRLGRLFRTGAAILGVGAAIQAVTYYLGFSSDVQRSAGINGLVFTIFACVLIFIATVQRFRDVVHFQSRS